ncbi:MAG: hypothetical protein J6U16_04530 [Ruminococcus sp.]|nr:hypothetical protein [Ruminococcus sp.]
MKIVFKVWNVLIIIGAVLSVISGLFNGGILGAVIALIFSLLSLFMAIKGFQGDYTGCKKLAFIALVLDAIGLVTSGFSGGAIFSLLLMIVYVVLCISLESKSY